MATIQIQKTRNAETITKTAMDQKQSLEVVQTMLHGSLSTLSYLRNFFAEKAFDQQAYDMAEKIHSYKDYAAGKLSKDLVQAKKPATNLRVLQRGRSKRADMFLDWLEKGAFPAIKNGHLQALQIYVHAEPADRSKIIEMYTFTIKYTTDKDGNRAVAGIEMDAPGPSQVSSQATNLAFQQLLLQLIGLCNRLPELPEKRFVSMELFYTPGIAKQYKPTDFQPGTGEVLAFPESEGWLRDTQTLSELDSFFHRSGLKVTSMVKSCFQKLAAPPVTHFPEDIRYTASISKLDDVCGPGIVAIAAEIAEDQSDPASATVTPSTIVDEPKDALKKAAEPIPAIVLAGNSDSLPLKSAMTVDLMAAPQVSHTGQIHESSALASKQSQVDSQLDGSINTQASNDKDMKNAFRHMMQPEHITQGDTQTQSLLHQHAAPQSEVTESPSRFTASPPKTELSAPAAIVKPMLSPTKASELKQNEKKLNKHAFDLAKKAGRKNTRGDVVLCQCGHTKEEDGMVQCTYCQTWQHLPCYGYMGTEDPRLPDDHTCYQCLFGDVEMATLMKLQDLALKRRAMDFALQHGLKTQTELARDLGIERGQAQHVITFLKNSGYVVAAAGSRKAGYSATGKPHFVPVKDGPKYQLMIGTLFDPLMHISHHYQLPAKPFTQMMALTQRLIASQAIDMPPPATPASQLRKRNAATPASGLDLRASMTPFETPSRPRGQQSLPNKRSLNDDERVTSPPKRLATPSSTFRRMRSMQTRYLIDANGLPSSPMEASY